MRNRGERRDNTDKKIKNFAKRFRDEHCGPYGYSRAEALRIAKVGGKRFPRWVFDDDRGW